MIKQVFFSFLLLIPVLDSRSQTAGEKELIFIDRLPLFIHTGLSLDSVQLPGTLFILSERIAIDLTTISKALQIKRSIILHDELEAINLSRVEYQVGISGQSGTGWKSLPLFQESCRLIDTTLAQDEKLSIRFRYKGHNELLQETVFHRISLRPTIEGYHIKASTDSGNTFLAGFSYRNVFGLYPGFEKNTNERIDLPAGSQVILQIKQHYEGCDSCLYYRLRDDENKLVSGWTLSGHILKPSGIKSNHRYTIEIRYAGIEAYTSFEINALAYWYQRPFILLLIAIAFSTLSYLIYERVVKFKNRNRHRDRLLLTEQLKNSQNLFNPHFLFNCFANIEVHIENNESGKANELMAQLEDLIREVLKHSGTQMIKLADELSILEKFIAIEQLRFPFRVELSIDPEIDLYSVEFPPMLLQPTVENAIRHGLAGMEGGVVRIDIRKSGTALMITISDNGSHAKPQPWEKKGHSISFTNECISKLQQFYPDTKLSYECVNTESGTTVRFEFGNWIKD